MKKLFRKFFLFFKKEHLLKYVVEIAFFTLLIGVFLFLARNDFISNVMGTIIGFVFSTVLLYIFRVVSASLEDILKVNKDTEALLKIYTDPAYRKRLTLNGTWVEFAYAHRLVDRDYTYEVVDDPQKMFQPDDFIMGCYRELFSAHSNSVKVNSTTVRLDDLVQEGDKVTFHLSRSTVFNHLITNRAIDFLLFDSVSLRDVYEYGPRMSTIKDSKMSNHVGINALVFLRDGNLLVPRRNRSSTISKNQITSSIAVKLALPESGEGITADYLLRGNILDNLTERVHIAPEDLRGRDIAIRFLGMGQNIYEGGKPQFYFAVELRDMDTAEYHRLSAKNESVSKLDVDKCIYTVDYNTYRFRKDSITFWAVLPNGHRRRMTVKYEMSYLCNLWHYEEYKNARTAKKDKGEHTDE